MQKQMSSKKPNSSLGERGKGVAAINMKEFKCQIDHEIAKCLDTLDRQGLKFLKETLRASKIFGLNTQELGLTQPVEESQSDEDSPKITKQQQPKVVKEVPKKIQMKSNVQIKKVVTKPEPPKKTVAVGAKASKGNMGDNINKRLQGLNIKTGKKNDIKNIKKEKVVEKVEAEIVEEIQIEDAQPPTEIPPKQQPIINYSSVPALMMGDSGKSWRKEELQDSPVKPFCKKQFKKEGKHRQHKDYGIEISKPEEFKKEISDKSQPLVQVQQQNIPIEEELNEPTLIQQKQVINQKQQTKQDVVKPKQKPLISPKPQKKEQIPKDQGFENLFNMIGRLSPSKRVRLERIIEKMQNSDKFENTSSLLSNVSKVEPSYHRPYIALSKNSEVRQNHSKSRSKLQKVQKATSLKSSVVRRMPGSQLTPQNRGNMTPLHKKTEPNVLQMYEDAKSQLISENRKQTPSLPLADKPKEQTKIQTLFNNKQQEKFDSLNVESKQMHSSVNLNVSNHSQLVAKNQSGQKLIKIGKKKNQLASLTFKVLSNHGHSSLVGLTAIHLFNPQSQLITVDETSLRHATPKLLKLFNDSLHDEGWLTSLSTATIYLENIPQTIAGIRIVNWNRSELEADRQADMMQIWINDQLHWRGQVKGGSFKESEIYATNIKVTEKHFEFPPIEPQSIVSQASSDLLVKNESIKKVQPNVEKERQVCWLEKETVEKQLKQLEEDERRQQKVKKIGSVRNTVATKNAQRRRDIMEQKPFEFNWLNQAKEKKEIQVKPMPKQQNDDILGQLSRVVEIKRQKQDNSLSIKKKDEAFSMVKDDALPTIKEKLKIREQSGSKKHQEYLLLKEKEQDEQFEKILQSMQQRSKPQEVQTKQNIITKEVFENKGRSVAQKNFQDFMKDSLFDEKPAKKLQFNGRQKTEERKPQVQAASKKNINTHQLDELIGQLNNVVGQGEQTGEQFNIPQLPVGKELSLVLLSNWGNQSFIGLNGIELFDVEGQSVRPIGVSCSFMAGKELFQKLLKQQLLTSDQKMQVRFPKGKRVPISLTLPQRTQLVALRIWNYNGHRVHNNIGVKKLHVKLDGNFIFSGEIQQSLGSSQDAYKYCEYVLFTENSNILKRIADNDWLTRITRRQEQERAMFRTTLQHFHRPATRNDEENLRQEVNIEKQPIKLSKRNCSEYDPPLLPQGFVLKLVLHSSWGDPFFIGLNGIEVFNQKGENITTKNLSQIRAQPSSVSKLEGYERDKRVIGNLINGNNNSTADCNIWLAPLLSDVEKIEKGRPNVILLEYSKPTRISGINFYNYAKTTSRGVREIQVFLDNFLLYRGYLRQNDATCIHTTIYFTKEQSLLEAMKFSGYNQDHLQQQVGLVNEQKLIRASSAVSFQQYLVRPMTGKLN